jgi:glucose-6-phosphate isomerase
VRAQSPPAEQQTLLVANALAQAQALLVGRGGDTLRQELAALGLQGTPLNAAFAARECPGNRASTTLLLPTLDAANLGALLALYEHRTFVESVLLGINAFDQFGVELGRSVDTCACQACGLVDAQALLTRERLLVAAPCFAPSSPASDRPRPRVTCSEVFSAPP